MIELQLCDRNAVILGLVPRIRRRPETGRIVEALPSLDRLWSADPRVKPEDDDEAPNRPPNIERGFPS